MVLTPRENSHYPVTQTMIKYILHIVGDFGTNVSDVENTSFSGVQREHLTTGWIRVCVSDKEGWIFKICKLYLQALGTIHT